MKNFIKNNRLIVICILIFIVAFVIIIGATYAFFQVQTSNNTTIQGYAESLDLDLTVEKHYPTDNSGLIPQLTNKITNAITGTGGNQCIDGNGNTVCHTYKVTLKNNSSSALYVSGTLVLDKKNNPNLRWARYEYVNSTPTLIGTAYTPVTTTFVTRDFYEAQETKIYYVVVWIEETGASQTDRGNYTGVITFFNNDTSISSASSLQTLIDLGLDDELKTDNLTSFTGIATDADTGIYKTQDDLGDSYYFRGNVTNNYVKFGKNSSNQDMYWRIIRINGDGTIRMIYDGTQAHQNGTSSEDRQVGTSAFNTRQNDNAFVGYMNGTTNGTNFPSGGTNSTSYAEAHANITNSAIKTYLEGTSANNYQDGWYYQNIVATGYGDYVADAIYCNDRKITTNQSIINIITAMVAITITNEGFGTYNTMYGIFDKINAEELALGNYVFTPSLICPQANDKFTKSTTIGNGKLTYPVGLITTDEVVFAGGAMTENTSYYLYTGDYYWAMSPNDFDNDHAGVVNVNSNGSANNTFNVNDLYGVRPVLSLKSDALQYNASTSNGTKDYPFIVS